MFGPTTLRAALLAGTALVLPGLALAQPAPNARPAGGQVVAGSAAINQSNAARTQVTQSTDRAVVNWQSFDVGRDHTVQFQQPAATSMTLNRVTGPDPSQIAGRIQANGGIAIVNQSGVVFHGGAQVDVGTLVVSSANISNQAFMAGGGRLVFDQPGRPGARIENNGSITVRDTGLAALVAPQVANRGTITARMGRVALGGGEASVVDLHGDGMLSLEVTSPVRQRPADGGALVSNDGTITATGGTVQLTAAAVDGIVQDLVRAGGRINADTDAATGRTGRVVVAGNGGSVRIEGEVNARGLADGTTGGTIQAIGSGNTLVAGTGRVDASGRAGGGRVELGTNAPGRAATQLSRRTGIASGGVVRADATGAGRGGTVLVNSTEYTAHAGSISATGGPAGGDGGFVEVSGRAGYRIIGGTVNVRAGLDGQNGTFLLDPTNITIVAGNGRDDENVGGDGILAAADPPANAQIGANFINNFAGDLRLEATNDILVSAAINKNPDTSSTGFLTLFAGNAIQVDATITNQLGSVTLEAGGQIRLNAALSALSSGATLNLTSGTGVIVAPGVTTLTATSGIVLSGGTVSKASGNLTFATSGTTNVGAPVVLSGGDLTFNGPVTMSQPVSVPDANRVTLGGSLTQTSGAGITAGTLAQSTSATTVNALGDNSVGTIESLDAFFGISFRNLRSLTVAGSVNSTSSFVTLDVVGDLTLGTRATVVAGDGAVTATATGNLTAETISTIRGEGVTLSAGGTMTLGGDVVSSTAFTTGPEAMSLTAGAGGIVQTGGRLFAGTLTVNSGGDVLLNVAPADPADGNRINGLTAPGVAGNLTLVSSLADSSDFSLRLRGTVDVGGRLTLVQRTGGIFGDFASAVRADRLDATVTAGSISLEGFNRIATLGDITAQSVTIENNRSLRVVGTVSATVSNVDLLLTGDLAVAGTLQGQTGVDVRAGGNITVEAGGVVRGANLGGSGTGGVRLAAGFDPDLEDGGAIDPDSNSGIFIAGQVGNPARADTVRLEAALGGITQTGGRISAGTLEISSEGNALLPGGSPGTPNAVAILNADVVGDLLYDNGTSNLLLNFGNSARNFSIRTSGDVDVQNAVTATQRTTFRVGALTLRPADLSSTFPQPAGTVTAPLIEIAPFTNTTVEFPLIPLSAGGFFLTPATLSRLSGDTLRIGATTFGGVTTTTATNITVNTFTWPGTLDLRATGTVGQATGATLSAGTLTGVAGSFTLNNVGNALPVLGDITADAGIVLATSGAQTVTGTLGAPLVSLSTQGNLTESGAGRITGGTLSVFVNNGSATLEGLNALTGLGASSVTGDLTLVNTSSTLTVPTGAVVGAAGTVTVNQTGALVVDGAVSSATAIALGTTGAQTINGTLDAPTVSLSAASGGVTEGAGGRLLAGTLSLNVGGSALLNGANFITALGTSTIAGNLSLNNTTASGTLTILAGNTVDVAGAAVVNQTGNLVVDGTVTAASLTLGSTGAQTINGTLDAASIALSASTVTEGATGRITGGTLSLNTGGDAALTGPNAITGLGTSTVGGDLNLTNASGTLTVASGATVNVTGAVTLDQTGNVAVDGTVVSGDAISLGSTGAQAINGTLDAPTVLLSTGSAVTQGAAGRIVGGTLFLNTGGDAALTGDNAVASLGESTVGGNLTLDNTSATLTIPSGNPVSVTGTATVSQTGDLAVNGTVGAGAIVLGASGSLAINGTLDSPSTSLAAGSTITEAATGRITRGTLALTAGGDATLTGVNALTGVGASSVGGSLTLANTSGTLTVPDGEVVGAAGGITLNQTGNLTVNGGIAAGTILTVRTSGSQTINGGLNAPTVALTSGAAVTEGAAGHIVAGTLTLATGGAASLVGPNGVGALGASRIGGNLDLNNASGTLSIPAGNLVNAAGTVAINQTGNLLVDGTITGTTTTLAASGALTVNGNSAIARSGDLTASGNTVTINGLVQAAGTIRLAAATAAGLAGRAVGGGLTVSAQTVTFNGFDAAAMPVDLLLGTSGTSSGTLTTSALRVFGGGGADLGGSIAGVSTGDAAALGRRGTATGTLLSEPLPNRDSFLFNGCAIGAAVCRVVEPPPPPPPLPPPPPPPFVPTEPDLTGLTTVADGPFDVPFSSDPAANPPPLDRLRPIIPNVTFRLFRDPSEQEELAPPNVRGEDY